MYTLGLEVLCTEHNIFMIKDLVRFRVIIFHVFITAVITTAALLSPRWWYNENNRYRHWILSVYLALYMEYFIEEIFDAHSNPIQKVPLQSHFYKWRGWDSLPNATSLTNGRLGFGPSPALTMRLYQGSQCACTGDIYPRVNNPKTRQRQK